MRRIRKTNFVILLLFIISVGIGAVIIKFLSENNLITSGIITYDDSLTIEEKSFLENIFNDAKIPHDVTFSARDTYSIDGTLDGNKIQSITHQDESSATLANTAVVYNISVPVVDFPSTKSNITLDEAKTANFIPLSELTIKQQLLSIDGNYYLDDNSAGARFRIIEVASDGDTNYFINTIADALPKNINYQDTMIIKQTGVTALSRDMQKQLNKVGNGAYFAENLKNFIQNHSTYLHTSNEVSFADGCTTDRSSTVLCADWRMLDTITTIDFDIIELTGNHNNDWGAENNIATIKKYHELGIKTFGGGINQEEAAKPLELNDKGTKITWIGINQSTSTIANGQGASDNHPGANIYDEELTKSQIATAKERGDFVIVDIQYFECYSYPDYGKEMPECDKPITNQREFFRKISDFGADLVVGTQAHQPQTFEIYNDKLIFYGLGNLFFDQVAWPGTTRSLILSHYFYNNQLIQTRINPTIFDNTFQTRLMTEKESTPFIDRLIKANS